MLFPHRRVGLRALLEWEDLAVDDVVAVSVTLDSGELRYFMTWGRIQDAVDGEQVVAVVIRYAKTCDLGGVAIGGELCASLRDARDQRYFYESLLEFAREPIPSGPDYEKWRSAKASAMEAGKELYYLGRP